MQKGLLFLIFIGLMSCSSDDTESATILGKWYKKGETINGGEFQNYVHNCATSKDFLEFSSNSELTSKRFSTNCEVSYFLPSIWVLNGNILTISSDPFDPMLYEDTYIVESITNEELVLKYLENEPDGVIVYRTTYTRN